MRKIEHFGGRALLADDMGLGKTFQALLYAYQNYDLWSADHEFVIVICPATVKWHWQSDAMHHIGVRAQVLEGRIPPKNFKFTAPIIVINYDILAKWKRHLKRLNASLIIIDECQKIKNPDTLQTKNTVEICRHKSPDVVALSGTPLENHPAELFPTLNILRPDIYSSFLAFGERYCAPRNKPWGREYKGATRKAELHRNLQRTCMIRRRKEDVLKDLPPKLRTMIPLDIENRKEYRDAEIDFIKWLKKKSARKANKANKAVELVKGGYLKRLASELKLKAIFQWIDEFLKETDKKIILFGVNYSVLDEIHERYKSISVVVNGKVTGRKRQNAIDAFNTNKKIRIFVGNIKAAGVGWSCRSASTVAFVQFGWTPGEHIQAEDRIYGLKRGLKGVAAQIYYLYARHTIEEKICKLLRRKQGNVKEILDGDDDGDELDVFDDVKMELLKAA